MAEARRWPGIDGMDLVPDVTAGQRFDWDETTWSLASRLRRTGRAAPQGRGHRLRRQAQHPAPARRAGCAVTVVPATASAEDIMALSPTACSCPTAPATRRRPASMRRRSSASIIDQQRADLRHLPRPPDAGAGARRQDGEDASGPPRRQPPGEGPHHRQGRDRLDEPRLRGRSRDAAGRRAARRTSRCSTARTAASRSPTARRSRCSIIPRPRRARTTATPCSAASSASWKPSAPSATAQPETRPRGYSLLRKPPKAMRPSGQGPCPEVRIDVAGLSRIEEGHAPGLGQVSTSRHRARRDRCGWRPAAPERQGTRPERREGRIDGVDLAQGRLALAAPPEGARDRSECPCAGRMGQGQHAEAMGHGHDRAARTPRPSRSAVAIQRSKLRLVPIGLFNPTAVGSLACQRLCQWSGPEPPSPGIITMSASRLRMHSSEPDGRGRHCLDPPPGQRPAYDGRSAARVSLSSFPSCIKPKPPS